MSLRCDGSTQRRARVAGRARAAPAAPRGRARCAFQCVDVLPLPQQVHAGPRARPGVRTPSAAMLPAQLLGDQEEEVHHVLGLAGKLLAQLRVLRGDADRAGVEVALAQHDAAHRDQARGGHAELLGAQQRGDEHVARGAQAAVDLHADAAAQPVLHQHLLRLGQAQLPRQARVLDARQRRGARAALVAGDDHAARARLGHAGGDGAHAHLAHQLHADARRGVHRLQVVDELGQVLDGVDVVVRRRRDQRHARRRTSAPWRCARPPCGRGAGRPRRAWRPGRS